MATGISRKDLSASIVTGSEEIFDFSCQPCSSENLHVEAVGYCQDCCEYLCDNCCKTHRKLSATKHHTMLDKSNMSKAKLGSIMKDVLTETCLKHNGKVLEYFCSDHNQICCSVCLTLNHSSCSNKSYIPDISDGIASSQEYSRLKTDLDKLVTLVTVQQKNIDTDRKDNEKLHSKALADINHFREKINTFLDKLEEDTIRKISSINKANSEKIANVSGEYSNLLSEVNNLKADLLRKETEGKNNQLYVTAKLSQDRTTALNNKINQCSRDKMVIYSFHQDEKIQQMMSTLSDIWSLSLRQGDKPNSTRYIREVNVKSEDDSEECDLCGIAVLTEYRVVVVDHVIKKVKLIDMKTNKLTSSLSMSSNPFDVVETKPNQLAVALANTAELEIITVSDVLTSIHTIDTPGAAITGLCYDGSNFITACHHPMSVKIIDMSGRTLNTFTTDSNGKDLFIRPFCITIGRDNDIVHVTDVGANTVTSMTTGGQVISVYRHDMLKCPHGVAVDKDGTVYVCSRETHTVHQLSPTGDFIRILLSQDRGLGRFPLAIAYSDEDDRLYICYSRSAPESCNYVRLYQLELTT